MSKYILCLTDEILSNNQILNGELFMRLIKKNVWQMNECDECMELLLSRRNNIENVVNSVIRLIRIVIIEEQIGNITNL